MVATRSSELDELSFPRPAAAREGPTALGTGGQNAKSLHPAAKAVNELKAEIKLLHWHKLANEAALKAAIMKTNKFNAKRRLPPPISLEEQTQRIQQVIEEEQARPLEVSKVYKLEVEKLQAEDEERLAQEIETHIECLRRLKADMAAREQLRNRQMKYKEDRRLLQQRQRARQSGAFRGPQRVGGGDDVAAKGRAAGGAVASSSSHLHDRAVKAMSEKKPGELTHVLESLNKLIELEKRITDLEQNNFYDKSLAAKNNPAAQRGLNNQVISIAKKQKTSSIHRPAGSYYAVSLVKRPPPTNKRTGRSLPFSSNSSTTSAASQAAGSARLSRPRGNSNRAAGSVASSGGSAATNKGSSRFIQNFRSIKGKQNDSGLSNRAAGRGGATGGRSLAGKPAAAAAAGRAAGGARRFR